MTTHEATASNETEIERQIDEFVTQVQRESAQRVRRKNHVYSGVSDPKSDRMNI